MPKYAEIDLQNGKCFSISFLAGEEQADNLIPLNDNQGVSLGDTYKNGVWIAYVAPEMTLEQAQTAKKAQLQNMYAQTLAAGFISSASGTAVTYGFAPSDQDNMTQIQSAISANIETWPVEYGDVHGNVIPLTQAQFTILETDANRFKWAQVKQLRTLIGQAMAATTNDAVNAVQWTAGTY